MDIFKTYEDNINVEALWIQCQEIRRLWINGYADDTDKADERGFKKLRYTIINDKLKSAFVRLVRVVRVSIYSLLHRYKSNSIPDLYNL